MNDDTCLKCGRSLSSERHHAMTYPDMEPVCRLDHYCREVSPEKETLHARTPTGYDQAFQVDRFCIRPFGHSGTEPHRDQRGVKW